MADTPTLVPSNGSTGKNDSRAESPAAPAAPAAPQVSRMRANILLATFAIAQMVDVFNLSSLIPALTKISEKLDMTFDEASWILSSYALTFASFLLLSGRISDVWSPKPTFVFGFTMVGAIALGCGFIKSKIGLIVLRAFQGLGAALTVPAAISLIIRVFPDPADQSKGLSWFVGSGAVGNILGLILGGVIVDRTTYSWVFWLVSILALPTAALTIFLIPAQPTPEKKRSLDLPGVFLLTSSLILFIFATTSSAEHGWGTAYVLAPLIISFFVIAAFGYWETRLPEDDALLPPSVWKIPNFTPLFFIALTPFLYLQCVMLLYTTLFQEDFGWSPLHTALHFLPLGVVGGPISVFAGPLFIRYPAKWLIVIGELGMLAGCLLNAFSDTKDMYWPLIFPGFVLGTAGGAVALVASNIALVQSAPPHMAGTIGAVYNSSLQLGAALGIAIVVSIQQGVNKQHGPDYHGYAGYQAAFLFVAAVTAVEAISAFLFLKTPAKPAESPAEAPAVEQAPGEKKGTV